MSRCTLAVWITLCAGSAVANAGPQSMRYRGDASQPFAIKVGPTASPDFLALLAYWKDQERMRLDAEARAKSTTHRTAIENGRRDVDRLARAAAWAQYAAEHSQRRVVFETEQARRAAEAESQLQDMDRQLSHFRVAEEQSARSNSAAALTATVQAFTATQNATLRTTIAAMAAQRSQDLDNVAIAREAVRVAYDRSSTREARWIRDSAWSAAACEVRERNTVTTMGANQNAAATSFIATATWESDATLHAQLVESRRRDAAVLSAIKPSAEREAQQRVSAFTREEGRYRAETLAKIEQEALKRAEEWARIDAQQDDTEYATGDDFPMDPRRVTTFSASPEALRAATIGAPIGIGLMVIISFAGLRRRVQLE